MNLKNKKIYISPYTNTTIDLSNNKLLRDANILGFIDKSKIGENVYRLNDIKEYDYILVCSPNHTTSILKDLTNYNTILVQYNNRKFFFNNISYQINKVYEYILNKQYKIKLLKNKHQGKRAFIIANGPSLNATDIELIKDEITFAANKIWLLFDQTSWRPNYYTVIDKLVMSQNIDNIEMMEANYKLFPTNMLDIVPKRVENSIYFKKDFDKNNLNFNLSKGIYTGPTVVYAMISYAIYMGIKELYIIGLDHNFTVPIEYQDLKKGTTIISEGEVNHFHKDYRKPGEKWGYPKLEEIEEVFVRLQEYALNHNIKIFNASRFTKSNAFKKVNLDDII